MQHQLRSTRKSILALELLEDRSVPALVAAYGFEEPSGTTALDASGTGNAGTLNGPTRVAGRYGAGLSFDGTNDLVTVADAASLRLTTGMTLSAWIYPIAVNGYETVILKERGTTGLTYALYGANDAGQPPAGYVYRGGDKSVVGPSSLPLNTWTYLAVTYDATTMRMFVNGTQVATKAQTGAMPTTGGLLRIGGNAVWSEWFSGVIDEVRIHNTALTAAQIQTEMNAPVVGNGSDTQPPNVSLSAPTAGETVTGTVTVTAAASDNVGVVGVQFYLDGNPLGTEDTTSPYSVSWNTATATNASHTLTAVARDAAGNATTSSTVTVTVSNLDTTPPTASVSSPSANATVSGTVSVGATASDNVGVVGVQFLVDGTALGAEDTTAPYSFSWDTTTATNGTHVLTARARDAAGNVTTSAARTVTVSNFVSNPDLVGQWSPVTNWPLVAINSVLLQDGRVLMWDGYPASNGADCIGSSSARVWDPATGAFTAVPIPYATGHEDDIFCSGQTIMADGRVLVVGGHDCDGRGWACRSSTSSIPPP